MRFTGSKESQGSLRKRTHCGAGSSFCSRHFQILTQCVQERVGTVLVELEQAGNKIYTVEHDYAVRCAPPL
jgi:hypothetical protein